MVIVGVGNVIFTHHQGLTLGLLPFCFLPVNSLNKHCPFYFCLLEEEESVLTKLRRKDRTERLASVACGGKNEICLIDSFLSKQLNLDEILRIDDRLSNQQL